MCKQSQISFHIPWTPFLSFTAFFIFNHYNVELLWPLAKLQGSGYLMLKRCVWGGEVKLCHTSKSPGPELPLSIVS